ncbi:MAG: IclR family transcriptional regulator [Chloroflexi bacterium]|nr:IclR family transcriptional regulator [Chloroflexota bacterium]
MELVHRAVRVLEALSEAPGGLGVSVLSEQLGLPPSSTHRLLAALGACRMVRQDADTRRYRLGPGVLRLRDAYLAQAGVPDQALPHLRALAEQLQETSFLTVLDGDQAVCVRAVESQRQFSFFMRPGQAMPLHCTASAKAILAFLPPDEAVRLLGQQPLRPFTARTPTRIETVLAQLEAVRRDGFAVSESELDEGVTALAAPLRFAQGRVAASATVLAPSERLGLGRRELALARLLECAERISAELGFPGVAARQAVPLPVPNGLSGGVA